MRKSIMNFIANLGIEYIADKKIKRKVSVFNQLMFAVIISEVFLTLAWLFVGDQGQSVVLVIQLTINSFSLLLVSRGSHLLARSMAVFTAIIGVTYVSYLTGRGAMTHLLLIYFVICLLVIFEYKKERKYIYTAFGLIYCCLLILEFGLFEKIDIKLSDPSSFFYYVHIGLSIVMFRVTLYFVEETEDYEKKLEGKNQELEKTQINLLEAKEKAENALAVKSQFLSNMSHEMRTPLNSILGFVELIKVEKDDKWEYLKYISKASENMATLVNDVLDYSKFESDKFVLKKEPFSVYKVVSDVYQLLKLSSEKKGIDFLKSIEADESSFLIGDEIRVKQILINLVSNAIKFTSQGSVSLLVSLVDHSERVKHLVVRVIDTGIGIDPLNYEMVFEGFTQIESEDKRSYYGTGLGLSIVKQLVEAMDGNIVLTSEQQKGTEFKIEIPFEVAKKQIIEHLAITDVHSIQEGLRLLIVDDNEMNLLLLENMFLAENAKIDLAESGHEALNKLKENEYDYLLIDLQMPEITGIDVYHQLQSNKDLYKLNKNVKTIIVTADIFDETRLEINDAGIDHVITKPIRRDELFTLINGLSV